MDAKLTDDLIAAEPTPAAGKTRKLFDGGGLYLLCMSNGRRGWRLKYYLHGREGQVSLGAHPETSLAGARIKAAEARKHINAGQNPAEVRRVERSAQHVATVTTFGKVGAEFLGLDDTRAARTIDKHQWLYGLLSPLHSKPIATIRAPDVLKVLRAIEAQGKREAAHRASQFAARVFRYAIQTGVATVNPAADLRGALKPKKVESHAGITNPAAFGVLMRVIDSTGDGLGYANVRHGLQLLARTALRPGELRQGLWAEVNFDKAEWVIPAERMKMRRPHLVPLSRQALAILRAQYEVSGDGPLIFPGVRSGRPMSDASMGAALKQVVPADVHVPHGYRVSFSTILNDRGIDSALIELQLSHAKRDKVASIYDRSQRVEERRVLVQAWSDLIDELRGYNLPAPSPP